MYKRQAIVEALARLSSSSKLAYFQRPEYILIRVFIIKKRAMTTGIASQKFLRLSEGIANSKRTARETMNPRKIATKSMTIFHGLVETIRR